MRERDPWERHNLAGMGLATVDRRAGSSLVFALGGLLFAVLALLVFTYALLENDARVNTPVYLGSSGLGPGAYLVPTPAGLPVVSYR